MRDPYSVLGVKRNADSDEIKAAWRSKAKTIHPDHNQDDPSATSRFTEVGQAYDVLKDPERRKRYDKAADMHQTIMQQRDAARQAAERAKAAQANAEKIMEELARVNAQRAQAQAQSQAQANGQASQSDETAEDMVERIFGAGSEGRAKSQAEARASQHTHQAQTKASPQPGNAEQVHPAGSTHAGGTTETPSDVKPPLPLMAVDLLAALVRRIRGTAPLPEKAPDLTVDTTVTIDELMKQASITVHLADEREVRLTLERGMTDGFVVRLRGQGLKVPGLKQGDLLVKLKVARDSRFRIEGFNLHTTLSISLEDAVLGSEATIETPDGSRTVTVPAWSGSDQSIRLEGLGLPDDAGGRGELVVELRVMLWEKPDEKVKDLMRHMRHGLYV